MERSGQSGPFAYRTYVKRMIAKLASLGKTVISIAHRFSTIMDAKHIILLAKDKVVAEGTHQEFLKTIVNSGVIRMMKLTNIYVELGF